MYKTIAIIPAAGAGVRMGGVRPKQFLTLSDRPILARTLVPFQLSQTVDGVIIVAPSEDVEFCRKTIVEKYQFQKVIKVVAGGTKRQDSVRLGLAAAPKNCRLVVIHDGVRPLITAMDIDRIVMEAERHPAVIVGLPVKETLKSVNADQMVTGTYDRSHAWLIQTPQVFQFKDILRAHQTAFKEDWGELTDDAALIEKLGISVRVMAGSQNNIKITTPHDLALAGFLLGKLNE